MSDIMFESDISIAPHLDADFGTEKLLEADMGMAVNLGGTKDYRKLINKPTINGTELYDNYDEIDPTVPAWAKNATKPQYTATEVGAVAETNEMTRPDIKSIWDKYF